MAKSADTRILNLTPDHRELVEMGVKLSTVNPDKDNKYGWLVAGNEGKINFGDSQPLLDIVVLGSMDEAFEGLAIQALILDGFFSPDEARKGLRRFYHQELLDQRDAEKRIKLAAFMPKERYRKLPMDVRQTLTQTLLGEWGDKKNLRSILLPSVAFWVYDRELTRRRAQEKVLASDEPGILEQYYGLLQKAGYVSESEVKANLTIARITYQGIDPESQWGLLSELVESHLEGIPDFQSEFNQLIAFSQ